MRRRKSDPPEIGDIQLGSTQRDTITGFTGIVVARADYLTGCSQALVETMISTGQVHARWIDYPRLEEVAEPRLAVAEDARRTGGPPPAAQPAHPQPR